MVSKRRSWKVLYQYCPPETAALIASGWTGVELEVIERADHFLHGQAAGVAARVSRWLGAADDR